jgi:hypothetical protein
MSARSKRRKIGIGQTFILLTLTASSLFLLLPKSMEVGTSLDGSLLTHGLMFPGDGRADFHWADKFTGDVTVFYNQGQIPSSGSSFTWSDAGEVWRGSAFNDRGTNFHFPNLNGLGRADMHDVDPRVNSVRVLLITLQLR